MQEQDRRRHARYPHHVEVALVLNSTEFEGSTLNISRKGVLLRTASKVEARIMIDGKEYHGRVVRVLRRDSGELDFALELDEPLELIENLKDRPEGA